MWKIKKWIFCRNCLTLFVSGREKNAPFRAHYLFWPKTVLGPKQCKPGSTIKIVVSAEISQNQKWHLFWEKMFFEMGKKVGFTNCVFEKLCSLKTLFYSVFRETPQLQYKHCMQKNRKLMKNSGLFLNMASGCFLFVFFQALLSLCFLSGKVARVLGVFVFLVFAFLFGVGFVSVCLLCFLWLDVVVSVSVFLVCFFVLFVCFFGRV